MNVEDDLNNALERMNAILNDILALEVVGDRSAAEMHGLLRNLSADTVTALVAIASLQLKGRKDGWA